MSSLFRLFILLSVLFKIFKLIPIFPFILTLVFSLIRAGILAILIIAPSPFQLLEACSSQMDILIQLLEVQSYEIVEGVFSSWGCGLEDRAIAKASKARVPSLKVSTCMNNVFRTMASIALYRVKGIVLRGSSASSSGSFTAKGV